LGCAIGEVNLNEKPQMNYRELPTHSWSMDSKNFYYHGLEKELPFTNIVRSMKENIYSYLLQTQKGTKLKVYGNGKQACRFDLLKGEHTLLINDQWDYNSLLWGNYMKLIKCGDKLNGEIVLRLE